MRIILVFFMILVSVNCVAQVNWELSNSGKPTNYAPLDMALAPNGDVYAICLISSFPGGYYSLFKSTNDGAQWSILPSTSFFSSNDYRAIICVNNSLLRVEGISSASKVYRSPDEGSSWFLTSGIPNGCNLNDFVRASNGDVYVGGSQFQGPAEIPKLFKSTNSGANWTEVPMQGLGNANVITALAFTDGKLLMAYAIWPSSKHKIMMSTDDGLNWYDSSIGLPPVGYYMLGFTIANNGDIYVISSTSTTMYNSSDGGSSWAKVPMTSNPAITGMSCILQSNGPLLLGGQGTPFTDYFFYKNTLLTTINEDAISSVCAFPNPTKNEITLQGLTKSPSGIKKIEIISVTGQITKEFLTEDSTVNLQGLQSGIYQLKITTSTEEFTSRVIKED